MTEASIRRRIQARLRAMSDYATQASAHADPASDDVADWLATIEDDLAIVRDRIGDLLHARAEKNPAPEPCNAPLGNIYAPDAIRCTAAAGHIGEHRNGDRTWA